MYVKPSPLDSNVPHVPSYDTASGATADLGNMCGDLLGASAHQYDQASGATASVNLDGLYNQASGATASVNLDDLYDQASGASSTVYDVAGSFEVAEFGFC
jgi:hypothetical protein